MARKSKRNSGKRGTVKQLPRQSKTRIIPTETRERRPTRRPAPGVVPTRRSLPREPTIAYRPKRTVVSPRIILVNAKPRPPRPRPLLRLVDRNRQPSVCSSRKTRREVLMSQGKVNRPGGAPGKNNHYVRNSDSKRSCK